MTEEAGPTWAAVMVAIAATTLAAGCTGDTSDTTATPSPNISTASISASATPPETGTPAMLRIKAGAADRGFAAAQISGTLARSDAGCLLIDNVLLVLPENAMEDSGGVVIAGKAYPLGGVLTGSGGFLGPGAVAQVMDEAGLAAWKACGAPQETAVIADASTVN